MNNKVLFNQHSIPLAIHDSGVLLKGGTTRKYDDEAMERMRLIVIRRYHGFTLREISDALGIGYQRVSQILHVYNYLVRMNRVYSDLGIITNECDIITRSQLHALREEYNRKHSKEEG